MDRKPEITYHWHAYNQLSIDQLYDILRLRQEVFIVEQNCPYLDIDDLDQHSWHLSGIDEEGRLAAYLRLTLPEYKYKEPAIGRVITRRDVRGTGVGRDLLNRGIYKCSQLFPHAGIRISAQVNAEGFYQSLGFEPVSDPYDEDGIPHISMLIKP